MGKRLLCDVWKEHEDNIGVVSNRGGNGASPRKELVVNGQTTKAHKKMSTPPPPYSTPHHSKILREKVFRGIVVDSYQSLPIHCSDLPLAVLAVLKLR